MTEGWYEHGDDVAAVRGGGTEEPAAWPRMAVESGAAPDEAAYYERLHEATVEAAARTVAEREGANDRQLVHAVRAMPVSDFEDAGFDVVGVGILPSAIDGCDYDDPGGRHLLLRRSKRPD